LLVFLEVALLSGASYLLLLSTDATSDGKYSDWIGLAIAVAFLAAIVTGPLTLMSPRVPPPHRHLMPVPVAFGVVASIGFLAIFLLGISGGDSAGNGALFRSLKVALAWTLCLCLTRSVVAHLTDFDAFKRRVLVVGNGARAREIARLAVAKPRARFKPVGFIDADAGGTSSGDADASGVLRTALALRASEVVVASEDRRGVPVGPLLQCKAEGIDVVDYLAFFERESGRLDLNALQPSWFLFSNGVRSDFVSVWVKRSFDIVVSLAAALTVLPLLLLALVALTIEGGGPALVRQERIGWRGRRFYLLRLRTTGMSAGGDAAPRWSEPASARRTWLGEFIHRSRIDDLPQFWNVLRGDMSLVGPHAERPIVFELVAREIPFYCARHAMRPGITGWAQVNYPYGATLEDARQKLSYDLYYLKNWSLGRDLLVLLEALGFVLRPGKLR
jgi:lipopolysaccharide/colanic/teichoic acid biosynthesis glycosyltransferase